MRQLALLGALALLSSSAIGQCVTGSYNGRQLTARWNWLTMIGETIDFVPYAGGIAAVHIVTAPTAISEASLVTAPYSTCPPTDLRILGWAWFHVPRPDHTLSLQGTIDGRRWYGAQVYLRLCPYCWQMFPAGGYYLDARKDNRIGAVILDPNGRITAMPDLVAYLVVPASGSW